MGKNKKKKSPEKKATAAAAVPEAQEQPTPTSPVSEKLEEEVSQLGKFSSDIFLTLNNPIL